MKSIKQGVALAMMLSATMISSAHALTVYTAGPGSLAKSLASGYEKKTGVKVNIFQATTGKVISNKNTLPILDYFLMELKGDELRVTTSDLETTLVGSIRVDGVESGGTIAAPAKLMLDSLKEFAEMPLTIEVNDQNWEIRLSWKSGSLSIPGASAVSYPAIPALSADCKEIGRAHV